MVLVGSVDLMEFGLWLVLFASCFGFCLRFVSCCYSVYVRCLVGWFCLRFCCGLIVRVNYDWMWLILALMHLRIGFGDYGRLFVL